jgi:hypothetical protein
MNFKEVLKAANKLRDTDHNYIPRFLTVTGVGNITPLKIGEVFGMDIIADPTCPKDTWYISDKKFEKKAERPLPDQTNGGMGIQA